LGRHMMAEINEYKNKKSIEVRVKR
jgi:hypothetical protein